MTARRFALALVIGLLVAAAAPAQSGRRLPQTGKPSSDDPIRLRADEVLLNITVTDPYGRIAVDLKQDEFIIAEDGQRQDIASFAVSRVPLNVVMLLDASGSVVSQIEELRNAAMAFIEQMSPDDRVSIIEFHTKIELIQDWTANADDLRHAISWRFRPGMIRTSDGNTTYGLTSLYDAIFLTAEEQLAKVDGRKVIIILTDGDDTSSKVTYEQALAATIKAGAVVYVVSKARAILQKAPRIYRARFERAETLMTDLAKRTGGQLFSPMTDKDMPKFYAEVAREVKSQYIITYIPKNEARDGRLRRIQVFLTRGGYKARTRESYYAPSSP